MTARVSEMSSLENILSPCSLYQQTSPRKGLQMLQTPPNCKLTSATISLLWSLKDYQTHPVAESHGLLSVFTLFKLFSVSLTFALTMKFKFHSQGLHHLAPFGFISSIFLHSLGSSHSSHASTSTLPSSFLSQDLFHILSSARKLTPLLLQQCSSYLLSSQLK